MLAISALTLPVMIVRFYMGWFQMLTIDLPLIIASFWSISAFYLWAQHELFPKDWKRTLMLMPALMAAGVALTLANSKGVLEAFRGSSRPSRAPPSTRLAIVRLRLTILNTGAAAAGCRMRSWPLAPISF